MGALVKTESIKYSAGNLDCRGELIYDESAKMQRPLMLMAPNWLGVIEPAIEVGKMLAGEGYVVFVADLFAEAKGPKGDENPMKFPKPLIENAVESRRRIAAAFDTMVQEAGARGMGDTK